jgi:uncharacterized membrane-anchored protein YitT (DUF2179 family)
MKNKVKELGIDLVVIFVASLLEAIGVTMFTIPNHIVPGGVTGLATALSKVIGVKVGLLSLIISVSIAAIGLWQMGIKLVFKSTIAAITLSLMIDPISNILPKYTENKLVAAVISGVIIGVAVGLLISREMSSGGTDTIALVLKKHYPHISTGNIMLVVDFAIVVLGAVVFRNIDVVLYSVFTLYTINKVVDTIQQGIDYAKLVYIISDNSNAIAEKLTNELDVGITIVPSVGGYSKENKHMLMVAVKKSKIPSILRAIKESDPNAFTIVQDATEIRGEGFKLE